MTKTNIKPAMLIAGTIALLALILLFKQSAPVYGSVSQGSEYQGTTTTQGSWLSDGQVKTSNGALGSVVVTGANTGVINIYDATTSDPTKRAASLSSSTILVASIPTNAVAGTYTFDRLLFYGLLVNIVGTVPTTTITFR